MVDSLDSCSGSPVDRWRSGVFTRAAALTHAGGTSSNSNADLRLGELQGTLFLGQGPITVGWG